MCHARTRARSDTSRCAGVLRAWAARGSQTRLCRHLPVSRPLGHSTRRRAVARGGGLHSERAAAERVWPRCGFLSRHAGRAPYALCPDGGPAWPGVGPGGTRFSRRDHTWCGHVSAIERPRNTFMRLSMVPSVTIGEMGCCHNPRSSQLRICMGAVSRRSLVCGGGFHKDSSLCTSIQAAAQHPVMSRWPVGASSVVSRHTWCIETQGTPVVVCPGRTRALYCGWCDMSGRIMVCAQGASSNAHVEICMSVECTCRCEYSYHIL